MDGAGTPAHIQSVYGQLVTSSTLAWVRSGTGADLPENAVPSGTGSGVVCRGRQHGTNVAGSTEFGRCKVGFSNRLVTLTTFDVLTEVPGAAKLEWRPFTRFSAPPKGSVAGVEGDTAVFIARELGRDGLLRPAVVELTASSYGTGMLKAYTDYSVEDVETGDILVEVEPVRYELKLDKFSKEPKISRERKVLASSSIFRFLEGKETTARMQKMLSYSYEKSTYFGQIKGAIKGLPVKITLPTGENKNQLWGMKDTSKQSESIMVGFDMEQNSAVDVVISAVEVREEQPFTGTFVSVFPDGSVRERRIEGMRLINYLDRINPEYSKLYAIKDQVMGSPSKLSQETFNKINLNQVEVVF